MLDESMIISDMSLDEIVNVADQRFTLTNGDEFLSDEIILRELTRYQSLAKQRCIID